jgi:hypothetical protein
MTLILIIGVALLHAQSATSNFYQYQQSLFPSLVGEANKGGEFYFRERG